MKRRRVLLTIGLVLAGAIGWLLWTVMSLRADLAEVQTAARDMRAAVQDGDTPGRDDAAIRFRHAAADAADATDGAAWSVMTWVPLVGDDAKGVRQLSRSLDVLGRDGLGPILDVIDGSRGMLAGGRVDLARLQSLKEPVGRSSDAFDRAAAEVEDLDSSGYAGPVKHQFDEYADTVTDADRALESAVTAVEVLPGMLGADGERDYLLLFQNNAEIRATGGMPGSWAQLHADEGELTLARQGTAGDFPFKDRPVMALSAAELEVYGRQLGTYFQDVGFTPDFPRAAELATAHWDARFPGTELDGVIALDPVALSYLLDATGPVMVAGRKLTSDNAVDELLSQPYLRLEPVAQDAYFAEAARTIFDAVTGKAGDPMTLAQSLARAAEERRLLISAADPRVQDALDGSRVEGELTRDDGSTPHVDVGLNDATGSKMSYYLRYQGEVRSTGCTDGRQTLDGTMTLSQAIAPSEAAALPDSVTGGGTHGTRPGSQLVFVRIHAPFGGEFGDIRLNGKTLRVKAVDLDGRPTVTVVTLLDDTNDLRLTWSMKSGPGQTGDGRLQMTPGVTPGGKSWSFASAC